MKVYLLYSFYDDSFYDDGECYESQSYNYLEKIVDSEEKAKKWVFEQAVKEYNKLASSELRFDEDGPYYVPLTEEEIEESNYELKQLNNLKFGDRMYIVDDFNGYEKCGFKYEIKEVE